MDEELKMAIEQISAGINDTKSQVEEVKESNKALKAENEQLKTAIDALEKKASTQVTVIEQKQAQYKPGINAARLMKCNLIANIDKKTAGEVAEEMYSNKAPEFVENVKALSAGGNGAALIQEGYFSEIYPLLKNQVSFMQLGAKKVPMPKGNLNINKCVQGSSAYWIGESQQPTTSKPKYANIRLQGKKLSVLVPVSNDLLRSSDFSSDEIFLNEIVRELAVAMDKAMYYGAGTQFTPRGIKNVEGIHSVDKSTVKFDPELAYTDMVQPIKKANIPMENFGWAFPPEIYTLIYNAKDNTGGYLYRDELLKGTFHRYPYVETNQIEVSSNVADVFFGSYGLCLVGDQIGLELKISEQATYTDVNDNVISAFSNDEVVAKGMMICDLALIYGKGFSYGRYKTVD